MDVFEFRGRMREKSSVDPEVERLASAAIGAATTPRATSWTLPPRVEGTAATAMASRAPRKMARSSSLPIPTNERT